MVKAFVGVLPIPLKKTPAEDLRGPTASSPNPFNNMRPSVVETAQVIIDRTAQLQAEIDVRGNDGGGVVAIAPGLYQINQIVMRDRVRLLGSGEHVTTLLDAGQDARDLGAGGNGPGLIASPDYVDQLALGAGANKWRHQGTLMNPSVESLTIDGNGFDITGNQAAYEIGPTWSNALLNPNFDSDYAGIAMCGTGIYIKNVQVVYCDGTGIDLYRGNTGWPAGSDYTPSDDPVTYIGRVNIWSCNRNGLYVRNFPDVEIDRVNAWNCKNDTKSFPTGYGVAVQSQFARFSTCHSWANRIGMGLWGTVFADILISEFCVQFGVKFYDLGVDNGSIINHLIMFNNARDYSEYLSIDRKVFINNLAINIDSDSAGPDTTSMRTGVMMTANANGSRIAGRIDCEVNNTYPATMVDMDSAEDITLDITANVNSNDNVAVCKFRGDSKRSQIDLRVKNLAAGASNIALWSQNGAGADMPVDGSNRIRVWYDTANVLDGQAYYTVQSPPEIELIK